MLSTRLATIERFSASLTWATDDEILLEVLGAKTGIHRLSAGGGAPQELIPLDAAAGETDQRRPFVLRRERVLLYASTVADGRTTLAMDSLADGRRARLEIEGVQALGMVDGRLVYAREDGNLMAVPLDVAAMRVTGPPSSFVSASRPRGSAPGWRSRMREPWSTAPARPSHA